MPVTEGMIGYQTKFKVWDAAASPPAYWEVGEVKDVTPPSDVIDTVEATHMQSPGGYKEFILGLTDAGECSFDINWVPGNDTDSKLRDIKAARDVVQCQLEYPNGATHTFNAFLMTLTPAVPVQDVMTQTVSWKVTGPITAVGPSSP